MKTQKPVVIGIGELLWDMLPGGRRAGGAPVNFVYHASCLGAEGHAISAVGNDDDGEEIIRELGRNGINYWVPKVDFPTGYVPVTLRDGIPSYVITENVAWDYIPLTEEAVSLVKRADAICFGTLAQRSKTSRETINALIGLTPAEALRVFDINIRQHYYSKELIEASLRKASVFKINDEELVLLCDLFCLGSDNEKACRFLLDTFRLSHLILTAGSEYSTVYTSDIVSTIPTPRVKVLDTVGAGDSFTGAFIYSLLTGMNVKEAHEQAVKTAAFVCTQAGAWVTY
ncbi:carbohydrate kinase [Massilibacteroides sp.]|uniref:carbohydrate kinase family protein n=1 Tax=Massilibacteroides sp. TaxID=2034766 RepID=UPI002636117D|nr:carbohydrate kinase [Massilibacteroides sp.]MDD4516191.1 carbohydrate kinase [Massilibacteroides sp.]